MRVVICGAGAIGACIAWFLSRRGAEVVVVACAASGKAGGFLALDWCDGSPLEALARRSFALHARLPGEIGGDWGYRRMATYSGAVDDRGACSAGLSWLSDDVRIDQRLGSHETTAQVDPARFTRALMNAAAANGAELIIGTAEGLVQDARGRAAGVRVEGEIVAGDAVVIAMGPWSILAAAWAPLPAVRGLKGHSLVFRTGELPAEALFLDCRQDGISDTPEVFPRPDGTTYACAASSTTPLPVDPAEVRPDPGAGEALRTMCGRIAPVLAESPVLAEQACYRPVTADGLPLMGPVPGLSGAYAATGHNVWGILNAPATGEAMAGLILDGEAQGLDLSPFDPARLARLDPQDLRVGGSG